MAMPNTPEVIELLSSSDEEEDYKRGAEKRKTPSYSHLPFCVSCDERCEGCPDSKFRKQSADAPSYMGNVSCRSIKRRSLSGDIIPGDNSDNFIELSCDFNCGVVTKVDEDRNQSNQSNDAVKVTEGIMPLLDNLRLKNVATCSSGGIIAFDGGHQSDDSYYNGSLRNLPLHYQQSDKWYVLVYFCRLNSFIFDTTLSCQCLNSVTLLLTGVVVGYSTFRIVLFCIFI